MMSKILRGGVAVAVLATIVGSVAAPAAHADDREWREHDRREEDKPKHAGMTEPAHYRAPPPARPLGLNASVKSSIRKTTINPESAPTN